MELVRAGLQHRVDDAALEKAFADVERRNLRLELSNRVERHRTATGRQCVGIQAEAVRDGHAVNRKAVEAGVYARERHLAARGLRSVERRERVPLHQIADVAIDGSDLTNIVCGQHCCRATGDIPCATNARRGHDDLLAGRLKCQRQLKGLAQRCVNVGHLRVGEAAGRRGNRVGAACADAGHAVGARRVGFYGGPRSTGNVNDRHRGVWYRSARCGDRPADRGSGFLCDRRSCDDDASCERH